MLAGAGPPHPQAWVAIVGQLISCQVLHDGHSQETRRSISPLLGARSVHAEGGFFSTSPTRLPEATRVQQGSALCVHRGSHIAVMSARRVQRPVARGSGRQPVEAAPPVDPKLMAVADWLRNEKRSHLHTKEAVQYEKVALASALP